VDKWIAFAERVGVPSVIAIMLLWYLMTQLQPSVETLTRSHSETAVAMSDLKNAVESGLDKVDNSIDTGLSQVDRHMVEQTAEQRITQNILREIKSDLRIHAIEGESPH